MNELISIIVPVFNVEKYLPRCIDSIVNQSYEQLEIILVDDGSPDRCPEICEEWAKKDTRIRVIHKQNGGQASARNRGLDIAKGDYVTFIDSDDYLHPDFISTLYKALTENNAEIAICSANFVDELDNILDEPQPELNGLYTGRDMLVRHAQCSWGYYVWPWNKLYKREIFNTLRYQEGVKGEDDRLLHHLFWNVQRVFAIPDRLYFYVQHEGSDSAKSNSFKMRDMDVYDGIIERLQFYKENDKDLLKCYSVRMLYSSLAKSLIHCYNSKEYSKEFEKRFKSIGKRIKEITGKDYRIYVGSRLPAWLLEHKPVLYIYYWKLQQIKNHKRRASK
ncbi:MAG: glycosyltransferase family 2 protein [Acutalibacteraceae bacterium]